MVAIQILACEPEAVPPSGVNAPSRDVAQELGNSLTFPAAGVALVASDISLCNCFFWPSPGCHSISPLKFELINSFVLDDPDVCGRATTLTGTVGQSDNRVLPREGALRCVRSLKLTTTTIPYVNPDAMVHVLLTLNEPLLQRSRPRGPLGLSLTTIKSGDWT